VFANRMKLLLIAALGLVAVLVAGIRFSGEFDAKIDVERTAMGPASLAVAGQLGKAETPAAKPASNAPVAPNTGDANEKDWPVTVTSAPYDGPTPEERKALADLRSAIAAAHARERNALPADLRPLMPAAPEIRLPARRLTSFEIDELRRKAAELRTGS
jgi:hypothetical protein